MFLILKSITCQVTEITLYPTLGEYYQYPLNEMMSYNAIVQDYLPCEIHPQISIAQVTNHHQEIFKTKGFKFKSLSSNFTHFAALTNNNSVFFYQWKDQQMKQVGQSINIDFENDCFNINLSIDFGIVVDCYLNNQLHFFQSIDGTSIIDHKFQSQRPQSTKILSILNGTKVFITYAQYYSDYSILSLLSNQLYNLSSLNFQFIDFDAPIKISPNIYILTLKAVYQYSISEESSFQYRSNLVQIQLNFTTIDVYYDYETNPKFDSILICAFYLQYTIIPLNGIENQAILNGSTEIQVFGEIFQIFQNQEYRIFQGFNYLEIYYYPQGDEFTYKLRIQKNSKLFLNNYNELFLFNEEIIVYLISQPFLSINLTNNESIVYNQKMNLICSEFLGVNQYILVKINLQILFPNDTNIYVMDNQELLEYRTYWNKEIYVQSFQSYSGQLLNYSINQVQVNYTQNTYSQFCQISQAFQLAQLLGTEYLIGYQNKSIEIFYFQNGFQQLISIDTNVISNCLQASYGIDPYLIIFGINNKNTIYLFQYDLNNTVYQQNFTFDQEFSDFLITFKNIIILIYKKEIQIMTLNFTNIFVLNELQIIKYFNKIQFNPIQIVMNIQQSLLYINNINEIIIVTISENNTPIPVSLIQVNYKIKQINLMNNQLILSYVCNNSQNICFEVYNIEKLPKFYYVKSLYSLNYDKNVIVQSDNLFLYVTYSNYSTYIYNPSYPQHMSLYYKLELKSPILCSVAIILNSINGYSMILQQETFYKLVSLQSITYSDQSSTVDFLKTYPQIIFNLSITSGLNQSVNYTLPNQSIIYFNNFIIFQDRINSLNVSWDMINFLTKSFTYPLNLIIDRQVSNCSINPDVPNCEINVNQIEIIDNKWINYSLITSINNTYFALQNNDSILILDIDLQVISNISYTNFGFSSCLNSVSSSFQLYSICENSSSLYLLTFDLMNITAIQEKEPIMLPDIFENICKLNIVQDQIFILGALPNQTQQLYWFNQSENNFICLSNMPSYYGFFTTECQDFSTVGIGISQNNTKLIIIVMVIQNSLFYRNMITEDYIVKLSQLGGFMDIIENYIKVYQVMIMDIFKSNIYIFVATPTCSYIFTFQLEAIISFQQPIPVQNIQTIPNYLNLTQTSNSIYQNGILVQPFLYQNYYVVGAYYLDNLLNNINEPYLMQGLFNTTSLQYAMIVDSNHSQ
ncbi:unnamed protein product [Paramecium sonneborni]|uniref:Uncharacterized protein n=1 Tax=Paramecium sonneborni TaxID=65129 RepID=A0A8S1RPV5_9CILI|nr:unnamed protein product [Paramecium sonneborni]